MTRTFYLYNYSMDLTLDKFSRGLLALLLSCFVLSSPTAAISSAQDDAELESLLSEEREEADRLRRRGLHKEALALLREHLRDEPEDAASRTLRAACRIDQGDWKGAELDDEPIVYI